jgi:hypothetical protein
MGIHVAGPMVLLLAALIATCHAHLDAFALLLIGLDTFHKQVIDFDDFADQLCNGVYVFKVRSFTVDHNLSPRNLLIGVGVRHVSFPRLRHYILNLLQKKAVAILANPQLLQAVIAF